MQSSCMSYISCCMALGRRTANVRWNVARQVTSGSGSGERPERRSSVSMPQSELEQKLLAQGKQIITLTESKTQVCARVRAPACVLACLLACVCACVSLRVPHTADKTRCNLVQNVATQHGGLCRNTARCDTVQRIAPKCTMSAAGMLPLERAD